MLPVPRPAALLLLALLPPGSFRAGGDAAPAPALVIEDHSRIADPKLAGGEAWIEFRLEAASGSAAAALEIVSGGSLMATPWTGTLTAGAPATRVSWDGRDARGRLCPPGSYRMRVRAAGLPNAWRPLDLVRLGVTEIEAQDSPGADDEFQMVYFMKGATYAFYATPAIHEYLNVARPGQISDLDLDDGSPRPAVAVHPDTASPALDGLNYEAYAYNYPLSYVRGARPRLELTFGATATHSGAAVPAGYPVAGVKIRAVCDGADPVGSTIVTPGGTARFDCGRLPHRVGRFDSELFVRWEYHEVSGSEWRPIAGHQAIPLRTYTLLGPPQFKAGASGTQYSGPWVEVADYESEWSRVFDVAVDDQLDLTYVHVHGFFGQHNGIPTAIEGVVYDAYPLGGDGGATHYYVFGANNMNLARLLNAHASGKFVNCSDNMGATTTMLAMMGAERMRPVRLGPMFLKAIWGIGAPGYTLNLWGGSHSFSYHHIVTDEDGVSVSDTCMQLDEDGLPLALPGWPGWNVRRPWAGPDGYDQLSSTNTVSKTLESLPGVQ